MHLTSVPSPHDDLILAIWRAGDAVRSRIETAAAAEGITFQQYAVLQILQDADDEGLPTLEIARRLVERSPGITGLIDRLEREGLIRRIRIPADRRQIRCVLTEKGRVLTGRLAEPVSAAKSQAMSMFTGHELGVLRYMMARIGRHLDD
jgi:DNA-binding MarR family transcriptional regulator